MEYDIDKKEIILNRELNKLDKFVLDFTSYLKNYVIVSGYVSILLGRSRATEDVDLLIPVMTEQEFYDLWRKLLKDNFECINTSKPEEAFNMLKSHAIRFFKEAIIPNIEFKIIKNDLDKYSFENKIKVVLGEEGLYISPLEIQIAYKLFLGSDKDIEDAKHLFSIFKEKINKHNLLSFLKKLKVEDKFKLISQNENRFRKA